MIIGVTGGYAAGKDTVADILVKKGFFHISFSDILREELKARKKRPTRDNLIIIGNELRTNQGPSVLARRSLSKIKEGENYVFSSIRNPSEVKLLMERNNFIMVNITTPVKERFNRIVKRNREGDPQSLKELIEKEKLENTSNPNSQQLNKVAKMAKITLANDSTIEKLELKTSKILEDWLFKLQEPRPDWDNYFMNIAEQVKLRATCMSPKKGSIIVKDKMIVSTGYNGSPKNVKHCTDGGCQRCTSRHLGKIKSGVYSEPCICCHSEENSIVQAAYNGTSTRGANLYTTFTPCTNCCKLIINAGIREVIAKTVYPDDVGTKLLKEAGVKLRILK